MDKSYITKVTNKFLNTKKLFLKHNFKINSKKLFGYLFPLFLILFLLIDKKLGPGRFQHIMCFHVFSKVSVMLFWGYVRLNKGASRVRNRALQGQSQLQGLERMTETFEYTWKHIKWYNQPDPKIADKII